MPPITRLGTGFCASEAEERILWICLRILSQSLRGWNLPE